MTFMLLMTAGTELGSTTLKRACRRFPWRVRISLIFSLSTVVKQVYRFMMLPNMATDMPATMMVAGRGAQPYDEEGRKRRFRQAVQNDQVGFQDLREAPAAPEQHGGKDPDGRHQQETCDSFIQCDAGVEKNGSVCHHIPQAQEDP